MNVQINERHRLQKLVVALAVAAAIASPAATAGADTGAPIKDENYRPSALLVGSATPSIVVATSPGFQWDDAALGAGSTLGILALGLGGILVLRRNRTEPQLS
jgi:hypothetical protein